jgi:hypothetical protein
MFTHAMGFFQEHASLKKPIPEHFFTSLLKDLSTEDLNNLWEPPFNKIYGT